MRLPFRTRARTVDHLGREQIADCPTAVSELWKNAYDAYARCAELHVFGGPHPVAALVDDGHGMSYAEFVERWLMLGTEAKAGDSDAPEADRKGLPRRVRQGQKGIGRLSVAYLGPTVLVLTKRSREVFVAALIDWRLFQNPYLTLDDVRVPVETFAHISEIRSALNSLFDGMIDNVWGDSDDGERRERLERAWAQFSDDEAKRSVEPTRDQIAQRALTGTLEERHLATWPVWRGESDHGTAMFIFDPTRELRVWVEDGSLQDDPEVEEVRRKLRVTLTGFTNPYSETSSDFRYAATAHDRQTETAIAGSEDVFSLGDLRELEHVVEGTFDAAGVFVGRVRAWGREVGEVVVQPTRPPPRGGQAFVGEFDVAFGTFEQEAKSSSHTPDVLGRLKAQADRFGGLALYRDGLRVQPYGRPENDFFGMEERRGKHAGREFWAHRRTFGAVSITRTGNPHLRDKAGREGIIDNQAAREFRLLVVDLLRTLARRYFGTDSELREQETTSANARYQRALRAEKDAKRKRLHSLRKSLSDNEAPLEQLTLRVAGLASALDDDTTVVDLDRTAAELEALKAQRAALALPPRPKKLAASVEDKYRAYRDRYAVVSVDLERCVRLWGARARASKISPESLARNALARNQRSVADQILRWRTTIGAMLEAEKKRWATKAQSDAHLYYSRASSLLDALVLGQMQLEQTLAEFERIGEQVLEELRPEYEGYIRAMRILEDGIDLEAAFSVASDEMSGLSEKVEQWQELAQLGITVEIVGHELNELARMVSSNLRRFPRDIRALPEFAQADSAFTALVQRLEFLSPLRLSGPRARRVVSGAEIESYLRDFFRVQLRDRGVQFDCTRRFTETGILEYPHRLLPVFVNLMNNALYWVALGSDRRIVLERRGDLVVFADSGPGIDPQDESSLFSLFFSRRVNGHGVGLFLCRLALAQGRSQIRLATEAERVLPGANFVLSFRELRSVNE